MNKFNAGLAPLAIVLILLAVVIVGGGTYLVVKHNTDVKVGTKSTPTSSIAISPTQSIVATNSSTPKPSTNTTASPAPIKAPTTAGSLTFASLQAAYDSGRNLNCVGPVSDEKGPPNRTRFYLTKAKIRYQTEQKDTDGQFKMWGGYQVYVPGVALYYVNSAGASASFPPGDYHYDGFPSGVTIAKYYSTLTCTLWTFDASVFAGSN